MRSFRLGLTMLFTAPLLSMAPVGLEFFKQNMAK